jgi:hypothetical protein
MVESAKAQQKLVAKAVALDIIQKLEGSVGLGENPRKSRKYGRKTGAPIRS